MEVFRNPLKEGYRSIPSSGNPALQDGERVINA